MLRNRIYVDAENAGVPLRRQAGKGAAVTKSVVNGKLDKALPPSVSLPLGVKEQKTENGKTRPLLGDKTNKTVKRAAAGQPSQKGKERSTGKSSGGIIKEKAIIHQPTITAPTPVKFELAANGNPALQTPSPSLARRKRKLQTPTPVRLLNSPAVVDPQRWSEFPVELAASETAKDIPFCAADFDLPDPNEMLLPLDMEEDQEEGPIYATLQVDDWDSLELRSYSPENLPIRSKRESISRLTAPTLASKAKRSEILVKRTSLSTMSPRILAVRSSAASSRSAPKQNFQSKQAFPLDDAVSLICGPFLDDTDEFLFDL